MPAQDGHMAMLEFRTALASLAPDHREALILVGASGLSYEEAALVCGCAVGTMKSRVNRARGRLADLLSEPPGRNPAWEAAAGAALSVAITA
jgi:RNA polymerase sigma-70 factor (ECF subfamily)